MNLLQRIVRYGRISAKSYLVPDSPPFLILFINSICNQKCEHCFYWQNLNRRDDLTVEELFALSRSLGRIENLNLSGGEPFLRPEFDVICRQFVQHNKVREIYVPTNAYFTDRIVAHVQSVLQEPELELFAVEMSLDGLGKFHDDFRRSKGSFARAMKTYDALAELQQRDERLRIHAISVATAVNMDEIKRLTTYLFDRCPRMDHHNLAIIRGDPMNPSLTGPGLERYGELYSYFRRLWAPREHGRYGATVEPLLQHVKIETIRKRTQVVPCQAGRLSAVVYSNGDVSVCELHEPIGNLRERSFAEIWGSEKARELRRSIAAKACYCTTEVFMWPSITYRPPALVSSLLQARPWRAPAPLAPGEKVVVRPEDAGEGSSDTEDAQKLASIRLEKPRTGAHIGSRGD